MLVSVCMVTHGAREWVARALDTLEAHTPADRYELVVVDNASTDGTDELLHERAARAPVPMRVEYCDRNLGFAAGNNLAANLARGDMLCLLNSDALVPAGWLDALVEPLLADDTIGVTLPLFVGLDGRLQEAGANVEPDGRVEAFGIRADPDDIEWSWPRRVTYGSAACWMTRTATFRRLGGFDAGYGLGYYEDVDFAFELARRGLRIELVPSVRVVHAQGASSPSNEVAVTRRDANQARFVARQAPLLAHRWHTLDLPNEPHRYIAARDVDMTRQVLVVGAAAPSPAPGTRLTIVPHAEAEQAVRNRFFLLDKVVAPDHWLADHAALLDEYQPQAQRRTGS